MLEGAHEHRARRTVAGMSISGALSLVAVVAVLVVVSVPRFEGIARAENEADAHVTAQLLAHALGSIGGAKQVSMRELLRRPELQGNLADAELLLHGTLLRRHGYLFEITGLDPSLSLPAAPLSLLTGERGALCSILAIRAWPWSGSSGGAAYLVTAAGASLLHPNTLSFWHGLQSAGALVESLAGWQPAP